MQFNKALVMSIGIAAMILATGCGRETIGDNVNGGDADNDDVNANLNYFGRYSSSPHYIGYGSGGYGDPLTADFNLNVCRHPQKTGPTCTAEDPDLSIYQWRFVRNIGWRKFSRYGAARKDWWEYKRQQGWPFTNYQKYGYNWWY